MEERVVTHQVVFNELQIQTRVHQLALDISKDYLGEDVILVGLLKGAFMFLHDLGVALERIKQNRNGVRDVYIDFLSVRSYGDAHEPGDLKIDMDILRTVREKHVIVVEDTADTMNTLAWVVKHLQSKQPATLATCVLVSKPDKHRHALELDYVGFTLAGLPFLGGYGLDVAGASRCVPYIFAVPE